MLKLNVGVNKKIGLPNYGSLGAAVYIEAETDSALLTRPVDLRKRVRELFALATAAVEDQLETQVARRPSTARRATARQLEALTSLAGRCMLTPTELAAEAGVAELADLPRIAASRLISRLQAIEADQVATAATNAVA